MVMMASILPCMFDFNFSLQFQQSVSDFKRNLTKSCCPASYFPVKRYSLKPGSKRYKLDVPVPYLKNVDVLAWQFQAGTSIK